MLRMNRILHHRLYNDREPANTTVCPNVFAVGTTPIQNYVVTLSSTINKNNKTLNNLRVLILNLIKNRRSK